MSDDIKKIPGSSPAPKPVDEAEENFKPKTLKFWAILISLFLVLFLVALDRTIIGTAIPQITQEFNSFGHIGWTFLWSILVFEIGSLICGVAPNSRAFIIGRAIAGLGGAGLFTGVTVVMIPLIPLRKRPAFQGVFGSVFGIASAMGPLIGGGLTDGVTWRWCFYINLPIGGLAVLCLIFFLRVPKNKQDPATVWQRVTRLDPLGTFFFVPSIVCLLLALQWGGSTYAWNNWRIIMLIVFFGALLLAFVTVQVTMPDTAAVSARIITRRSIWAGAVFMFCLAGSMMMIVYFTPLWFQVVQGVSAVDSGVYTLPFMLGLVVASIISGGVTTKIGYYVPAMIFSPSLLSVGQGLMGTFTIRETPAHWIGYQFVAGFGLGCGMQSAGLAAQAVLPKPDIPTGIAIMFFSQQLGGAVFTSVGQNLLSSRMTSQIGHIIHEIEDTASDIVDQGAGDLVAKVPPELRSRVREAYNSAITTIFLCGMGVALCGVVAALFMEWKNIKKTGSDDASDDASPVPEQPHGVILRSPGPA
ncbi:hypothetical protein DL764_008935 [Monosporascus ibericus]|uniref:Major facilitator superfamily (MFS) profile domain-containing protein n=1 Tax=Monosporascus ibericus TaxID=155417 RepID=A0A4Q4SZE8_9PEZI|nr:hypothetical protein DL764_008935 [Monosporascus ibericus]